MLISALAVALYILVGASYWPVARAAEGEIKLPPNFKVKAFASELNSPRFMAFDSDGNLFVTLPREGQVVVLPDRDHDGTADTKVVFASGLDLPHGIAIHENHVYVAEQGRVVRFTDRDRDLKGENMEVVVADLPSGGSHWTRTLGFGPDGKMYISIGSSCNICIEKDNRRATIMVYRPDGTDGRIFASGLRNSVGFVWEVSTGRLWATDNGRDWLGDDLPPDELNEIREGAHYGWPFCYSNKVPDPEYSNPQFCSSTTPAAFEFQAHSAPLGLAFYKNNHFPEEYKGDLFVAFHGSWNRSVPTGYKVIRIKMKEGKPSAIEDFATGWLVGDKAWGRPVDIAINPEGRMLISDDYGGKIYYIYYSE